jgi:hypothetical protein
MPLIHRNLEDHLSYYIKPDGSITAVMPDQEPTFTLAFIRDFVGANIELACYTDDGYAVIRNTDAEAQGLPVNETATAILREATGEERVIRGRAFLIHPDHFDRRLMPAA